MLDWLVALPPFAFAAVLVIGAGSLILGGVLAALAVSGKRDPYRLSPAVEHSSRGSQAAQDYADLLRLLNTLRALLLQDPQQQAIREELLRKLTALASASVLATPAARRG